MNQEPSRQTPPDTREFLRKAIHFGSISIALLFRFEWFRTWMALAISGSALLVNLFLLPRMKRAFYREGEARYRTGVIYYPLAVTVLIVVFWVFLDRPEIAGAGWAVMAAGDGCATLIGKWIGRRKLPWNPNKTWEGFAGFLLAGIPVTAFVLWFVSPAGPFAVPFSTALLAGFFSALVGAVLESLPWKIDDNLVVPFAGAILSFLILAVAD